jgi:hypothetical protein
MNNSLNMIIFKNIFDYQYSYSEEWYDVLKLSHANDMQELIDISNELEKYQYIDISHHKVFFKYQLIRHNAVKIFDQYGYNINTWKLFCTIN